MSTLHSTHDDIYDAWLADDPPRIDASASFSDDGLYLTDELFLFRVLGVLDTDAGEMVELEDSFGLDVVLVPIADPRLLGLRVVMPAPGHG